VEEFDELKIHYYCYYYYYYFDLYLIYTIIPIDDLLDLDKITDKEITHVYSPINVKSIELREFLDLRILHKNLKNYECVQNIL